MSSFCLPNPAPAVQYLCMAGTIRTKERCPQCGEKFQETTRGFVCKPCNREARRYFLDIPQLVKFGLERKLYTDSNGYPFATFEHAVQELSTIRTEIRKGTFDPARYSKKEIRALKFENYAQAWLQQRAQEIEYDGISRGYLRSVKSYVRNYLVPFLGNTSIKDIRESHIEDFRRQLPRTLKPKTVKNILSILHKILADASRRRDIERLPHFPTVEVDKTETKWLDEADQERFLAEIEEPAVRAFFLFMFRQGTRPGEARALRWERIDFKRNRVTIRAAMDEEVYRERTKERDVRVLPLDERVREALEQLPTRGIGGFVFTRNGQPLKDNSMSGLWRRLGKKLGIDANLYQGTRHSAASQAVNAGVDMRIIQEFLGHKDPRSTARYAHLRTETLKAFWHREECPQDVPKRKNGKANILKLKG